MKKMTSRQRLLAVSRQQPVDMIPVSPRLGYAAHYHVGTESPQNILRLKKIYDFDPFITIQGQSYCFFEPFEMLISSCNILLASTKNQDVYNHLFIAAFLVYLTFFCIPATT